MTHVEIPCVRAWTVALSPTFKVISHLDILKNIVGSIHLDIKQHKTQNEQGSVEAAVMSLHHQGYNSDSPLIFTRRLGYRVRHVFIEFQVQT